MLDAYAAFGAVSFVVLALLHGLVWQVQRERWSLAFAAAFAIGAAVYGFDASLRPAGDHPHPLASVMALTALTLLLVGMIDYVGVSGPLARRLRLGAIGAGALWLVLVVSGALTRLQALAGMSLFLVGQAALAVWAMRREPRRGHGFVALALTLYPMVVLAGALGWVPVPLLRYLVILPIVTTGMTVLTTGLLRAHRRAGEELQRREQAEEAMRALNATLEQRVAQRTAELHEMVDGLESFNRTVSHDLRGPLGGIAGVARLARQALAHGDLGAGQQMLDVIAAQAEDSAALVNDLLALARVGDATLKAQPLALEPLVQETLQALQRIEPEAVALPVTVQPLPRVKADPALLRQVYVNLVGNALKFTRDVPQPRIEIGAHNENGALVLFVRDNGVGFDADAAARLFQPFQRLHGQRFPGHGVGLSIVKRIVERHGGRVWAHANPGAGATFFFTLGSAS